MPNGHDYSKQYGLHNYPDTEGTHDCKNRCGCWMGPARSGGPIGVDPFGECPKNPKDGKLLGDNADQEVVVTRRIRVLERSAAEANIRAEELEEIDNSKKAEVFRENKRLKKELEELGQVLTAANNMFQRAIERLQKGGQTE